MEENKKEITLSDFEEKGKAYNKKGIKRSYFDVLKHIDEYPNSFEGNLDDYSYILLQAQFDKDALNKFMELLNKHHFQIYNNPDVLFLNNLKNRLNNRPKTLANLNDLAKANEMLKRYENKPLYEEIENEDVVLYFLPQNEKVKTLHDFFKVYKDEFLNFSKENDLTLILRTLEKRKRIAGFFAFNFYDKIDDEVKSFDFAARFELKTKSNTPALFVEECKNLEALGKNKFELDEINVFLTKEE